ncbi:hypothetical protein HC031_03525 [Planosporangium thailandense]|uniref:PLL-like beta propeller domain-containing protein n=1 Tax=Planosporangium thailandense TaxID=765197 RepID=A0ABX0XTN3_9ACTN|nr:carboxypeptidase regulatory-like domain-containing protein [Planosporangium thailandense]NJC68800.1 hypothetical protein [Planosporangium thailandense]
MGHQVRRAVLAACAGLLAAVTSVAVAGPAHAAIPGTVTVTVTDYTGAPVAGAKIEMSPNGQTWYLAGTTGTDGGHTLGGVTPGTYKVRIQAPGGLVQYVPGKTVADQATAYQVQSGQTTQVTDRLIASGSVQISLVDRVSGAPVTRGCVRIGPSNRVCDHADGRYFFAGVPTGPQTIVVESTKTAWPASQGVTVPAGPADFPMKLDPAAAIQTTVQAADNAAIHPSTCVLAVYHGADAATNTNCDIDPATGSLLIGPLASTAVQLFAVSASVFVPGSPFNPVYGAQWVGATGGTGDQRQALKVNTKAGTVTTIPPIRLDHAGSIAGSLDDPYYGDSGTYAWVRPFGLQDGLRNLPAPGLVDYAYVGGIYRINGLGPYAWPVQFAGERGVYAEQWSGNAPDRYAAIPVHVVAGQTASLNATMTYATGGITGRMRLTDADTPASGFWVSATNAVTGDDTGLGYMLQGNSFAVAGLNADPVVLSGGYAGGPPCTATRRTPTQGPNSQNVVLTFPAVTTFPATVSCGSFAPPRTVPPALTSKPAASYNPGTHRLDVFANAGGSVVERLWDPKSGWSALNNFGGNIAGAPTSIYNPRYGTTEVYARSGNHLIYKYSGNGWSNWIDLGGDLAGDPEVIYNPRYGTTEIYVRTSANHVAYKYWSNGWSSWIDLGGSLAGDPTLLYNPRYGTTEIYARSGSHLVYKYWGNSWSGWIDLGGSLAGDPTLLYNPRYGTTEIYVRTSANHVAYKYWGNSWSSWFDLGGSPAGDPQVIYNPRYGTTEIYVRTSAHHVAYKYWGNSWSSWFDLGGDLAADPAVIYNPGTTNTHIYADGDGYLYEKYWDGQAGAWTTWTNLSP